MQNNDKGHEKKVRIFTMIVTIMLSVIVTIISAIKLNSANPSNANSTISLDTINVGIALLLGCCTFIITELMTLVYYSISYTKQQLEDEKFMDNISEYSHLLHDINRFY